MLIAAAASELHPRAVTKGIESQTVKDALREGHRRGDRAAAWKACRPSRSGDQLFWGDDKLEEAAAAVS